MAKMLKEIIELLNRFAPNDLSYQWDNTGLMVGNPNQEVESILLTLDVTAKVVDYAIDHHIDLIISHHPFIFKAIKKVTNPLIIKLIKNDIAVYSAHTNLDLVSNGVNFALAKKLNLENTRFLQRDIDKEFYQISVFIPEECVDKVKNAVFKAGAGQIGQYAQCSSQYSVQGQFLPLIGAKPSCGMIDQLEIKDEIKCEFYVDAIHLKNVVSIMLNSHPYETPVYSVTQLKQFSPNYGLGVWADLNEAMTLIDFSHYVKEKLNAPFVKLWVANKNESSMIKKIALCGGNGSSLLFLVSQADVFITGDVTYHQFLDSSVPIIDAGHFYTEQPVLDVVEEWLAPLELNVAKISIDQHDIQKLKVY